MKKKGETLQRVVAALERALNPDDGVTVSSPKRLPDRTTKRGREHDVVVQDPRSSKTTALECRDRSRLVGVPEVEAFSKKCERTTVDQGKLVSSKGFAKTALAVAKDEKIECRRVDAVEGFDWFEPGGLTLPMRTPLHLTFFVEAERKPAAGAKVFLADGTLVDDTLARRLVKDAFIKNPEVVPQPDGEHTQTLIHTSSGCYVIEPDGTRLRVTRVVTAMRYRQESQAARFEFGEYIDAATGARLSGAAAAHFELGGQDSSLVLAEAASGEKLVALVRQPKRARSKGARGAKA